MEDAVKDLCDQLSLMELEREAIQVKLYPLEGLISKGHNCLITKLHTSRTYNREAFKNTMRKVWRPVKMVRFHDIGSDMMMVEFESTLDKERVLKANPWKFDRSLMLMKEYDEKQQMSKLEIIFGFGS